MNDSQRKTQDFNRLTQAIKGLDNHSIRCVYRALIGALRQSVSVRDFSESIDVAIDVANNFKKPIMGINAKVYLMKGGSHDEKKSVA